MSSNASSSSAFYFRWSADQGIFLILRKLFEKENDFLQQTIILLSLYFSIQMLYTFDIENYDFW